MSVHEIKAIDVHAHYGPFQLKESPVFSQLMSSGADRVVERAKMSNTEFTFVSPSGALTPPGDNDAITWNEQASNDIRRIPELRFWVVVDPRKAETYDQAEIMLKLPHCVGIKIHPESHSYPISEFGSEIFRFAHENSAVVLSHSGHENSAPEEFITFANEFPDVTMIIAHLGNTRDGNPVHQVSAIQKAQHGNLYVDTSSSMSILSGLLEWAVHEIGSDRILYGTDSPLYLAPMQRMRIDIAEIEDEDKKKILRKNAIRLFGPEL